LRSAGAHSAADSYCYAAVERKVFSEDPKLIIRVIYTALFTTNGRQRKKAKNNTYRIKKEKKLDYDLTKHT